MIEKLYPDLMKQVTKMHKDGKSWDAISRIVTDEVGIDVSREVLRRWHNDQKPQAKS